MPLLKAMGFEDVDHYHGVTEVGKDIVMWKLNDFRSRKNSAVVVKRGNINARAAGNGSAAEVANQIRMALGSKFPDKKTGQEQEVHECIVAASGTINKDARRAITAHLNDSNLSKNIQYLDGDEVKRLCEKFDSSARHLIVEDLELDPTLFRYRDQHGRRFLYIAHVNVRTFPSDTSAFDCEMRLVKIDSHNGGERKSRDASALKVTGSWYTYRQTIPPGSTGALIYSEWIQHYTQILIC